VNVIFGAGGFAREVGWLLDDIARHANSGECVDLFVASDDAPNIGQRIHGAEIIGESRFFDQYGATTANIYIAVGSMRLRQLLHGKCVERFDNAVFPALVHPSVRMDRRQDAVRLGSGSIICAGTVLTTDIRIGEFVHLNLNCTVGHDTVIGDYSTLSPGVHVSGGVRLGKGCFVGTGAVFLENVGAPEDTVVGAGATVVKTIEVPGTYVGTPARLRT
jgi:sugar O-acyltransferase (sialic acid O-acetyltransferase NeuD family)